MIKDEAIRKSIVLSPGSGRAYPMGRMSAIFKADGEETGSSYSVSEWFLEPNTKGPGAHAHSDDHVFYVIEGIMSVFLDSEWINAEKGSCIVIPGGTQHDFENRTSKRAGILSFNNASGFEKNIPFISKWFAENPLGDAQ